MRVAWCPCPGMAVWAWLAIGVGGARQHWGVWGVRGVVLAQGELCGCGWLGVGGVRLHWGVWVCVAWCWHPAALGCSGDCGVVLVPKHGCPGVVG